MASPPRFFEDKAYYHIYNRGNRKQQIFLHYRDYERFITKIIKYRKKYLIDIITYCLMPNHFHFLLEQLANGSISKFLSDLCNSHSRYFNIKYGLVGSLFQGRFKTKKVETDEYLVHLSRYIHLNPFELFGIVHENKVDQLLQYKWSSFPTYSTGRSDEIVNVKPVLNYFSSKNPIEDYKQFVLANIDTRIDPIIEDLTFDESFNLVGRVRKTYEV